MKRYNRWLGSVCVLAALIVAVPSFAQDIAGFRNGYITFENADTSLYYRVEFKPNLTGPEEWAAQLPRNIKSSDPEVTVPVGVFYRVAGSNTPFAGDATGNATVGQVLIGSTFSTAAETGLTGTMPSRTGLVEAQDRTLSGTTLWLRPQPGYYPADANNYVTFTDAYFTAGNIRAGVSIFGLSGTLKAAGVPKTGQTTVFQAGDDGTYQKGVASPSPRFTVGSGISSNCVTDNLTGLMWLKNPDDVLKTWTDAITYCEALDGTSGRGGYSDWRLPNVKELQSLIDFGNQSPALPTGHPFVLATPDLNWSSTTDSAFTGYKWAVFLVNGALHYEVKANAYSVWPARGGQ